MKITVDTFNERFDKFVMQVVVPSAKKISTLATIGFVKGIGLLKLTDETLAKLKRGGVLDDAGEIDLELFRKGIEGSLELAGKYPIEDLGITLSKAEAEKMLHVLETGSLT